MHEALDDYSTYVLGAVGAATLYFLYLLLRTDIEAPVLYHVPSPEQAQPGWKGQVLQEPTLKVRMPLAGFFLIAPDTLRSQARRSSNATPRPQAKRSAASTPPP
jgi:hypothetical protein